MVLAVSEPAMTARMVPPELPDPVVGDFQPRRVIVFGSVAGGEAEPDRPVATGMAGLTSDGNSLPNVPFG